ncbi:MAG: DUF3089 domain-containing protein [Brevundimonas sp.]
MRLGPKGRLAAWTAGALIALLAVAAIVWRSDILQALLDPEIPYPAYEPPPAPDYGEAVSWALLESRDPRSDEAAVFFVHPTTYDGGDEWNSPVREEASDRFLNRVILPNYAAPFARAGAISAPHYREASLYTRLTIRQDAREARAFAYRDVRTAFDTWLARHPTGPVMIAGVEQGGELVDRLLHERIIGDADLRARLVAVYLLDTLTPSARHIGVPACARPEQYGCVVAWGAVEVNEESAARRRLRRALTWDARGRLVGLNGLEPLCVNPITGSLDRPIATKRDSLGATNATRLEWGTRPALLSRAVAAECKGGLLRYVRPEAESFERPRAWADQRKVPPYSLFYADIERDALNRLAAWKEDHGS